MNVEGFFDPKTWTVTYLVWDSATRDAVVIDPVLDYDPIRSRIKDESVRKVLARLGELDATLHWVLETHAHADHLSGADLLRRRTGSRIAVGRRITEVQSMVSHLFRLGPDFPVDGRQFDCLVGEGDAITAGSLKITAIETPGHTPACVTWHIGDALFTGDALFMPDQGTGRCDFPHGSAAQLFDSVRKLYQLPGDTRVFVGHDYQPGGRAVAFETTVAQERETNIQLRSETPRADFIAWRQARDKTLGLPALIFPSLQVNVRAGALPPPVDGARFLAVPLNAFDGPLPE